MSAASDGQRSCPTAPRTRLAAATVLALAAGSLGLGYHRAEPPAPTPAACLGPALVGHRGSPLRAPENSLASFAAALAEGADWLETDVRTTRDGVPVLLHDPTVDRTTDGTGQVQDLTYDQVARLRTKDGKGEHPVPRLTDLLEWLPGRGTRLLMEIKELRDPQDAARIARLAADSGQDVELYSFDAATLVTAHGAAPDLPVTLIQAGWHADDPGSLPLRALSLESALAAEGTRVDTEHRKGRQVYAWTVDDGRQWDGLTALGVDALITDDPAGARAWRDHRCAAARQAPERVRP